MVLGVVYAGSGDGYLYALDAKTGVLRWKYNTGSLINASSPVVSGDAVYIGNRNGDLDAINIITGQLKWKYNADGVSLEMTRLVVSNGAVYFSSWYNIADFSIAGSVYAVNANTGALIWKSLDNLGFGSGPVVANGSLYISADDLNFYALNTGTGSIEWKDNMILNGALPTVNQGTIFVAGGDFIYALSPANGDIKWKFSLIPYGGDGSKPYITDANGD